MSRKNRDDTMTFTTLHQEVLLRIDDRVEKLADKFDSLETDISAIKIQTTKTNGRVNMLESKLASLSCQNGGCKNDAEEITQKAWLLLLFKHPEWALIAFLVVVLAVALLGADVIVFVFESLKNIFIGA